MKDNSFKATSLQTVLIISVVVIMAACGAGFYFAQNQLKSYSDSVVDSISKSKSGITSSDGIQALEQALSARASDIERADSLTSEAGNYQSKAIADLTQYASQTNLPISNYSVVGSNEVGVPISVIEGVETKYIKIEFDKPLKFSSFVKFLKLIETNTPKMQIIGITISQTNGDNITVAPMIIELYTEKL